MVVAATVSTKRSHLHSTESMAVAASTIATADFDDRWSAISETAERTRN